MWKSSWSALSVGSAWLSAEFKSRLDELLDAIEYLTVSRWYGEDKLSLLMVAALHGDDDIVRLLLTWDPSNKQIELQDTFLREDRTRMTGVSALYCFVHVIEDIFMWRRHSSNWAKAMSMDIHGSIPDIHDFSVLRRRIVLISFDFSSRIETAMWTKRNEMITVNSQLWCVQLKLVTLHSFNIFSMRVQMWIVLLQVIMSMLERHRERSPRMIGACLSRRCDNRSFAPGTCCGIRFSLHYSIPLETIFDRHGCVCLLEFINGTNAESDGILEDLARISSA